ncbi:hypothetical protein ASG84_04175 [Rhodococcus sp. Leaf278]|uniref:type IV toxin-antitoxin system AbiEi family antitoxin domain-containing protein n=1 Tax=Rhodococcus sp. Leaf278 TaxID=1736319 RepID=UPI00070C661C|nr:type IV toxin-antitoxin system AbiEi family antitoxin domain-containing protein [Rhodococcus sp. Leaf278]KQU53749.1 hypothetical protein ASG84_04175 [Rhodococcus sp. Leaf278]
MHPDANGLISRATALRAGYTNTDLQRLCARGELVRIVPGMYAQRQLCSTLDPQGIHRLTTIASLATNADAAVASHVSAAVLHGLDLWDTDLGRVHLTIPGGKGRTTARLHVHSTPLPNEFVTTGLGIPATSPERTVVDCARLLDLDHAVVIGDSALRSKKVSMDRLRAALEVSARMNGIGAARRAIAAMSGLSESPGESISRLRMKEYGFPDPVLQQVLRVGSQFLARVDFYWRRWRLVGEFDGMGKYETGRTLTQEKFREDRLRDRGLEVFRWTWKDLWQFDMVRERFDRACARAERRRECADRMFS